MQLPDDFYFSQSNLKDYLDCPRRFYLKHVQRLPWPAVPQEPAQELEREAERGARFHRLAQQFFLGVPEERLAAGLDEQMRAWWEAFTRAARPLRPLRPRVETSLIGEVSGAPLLAKYDLLLSEPGAAPRTAIYDWKTYRSLPRLAHIAGSLQTRVYRFVAAQVGLGAGELPPEQIEMVYWFANFPDQPIRLPYSPAAYAQDGLYLEGLTADILRREAAEFEPTERTAACKYCQYRSFCGRGTTAGVLDLDANPDLEADLDGGPQPAQSDLNLDDLAEIAL
jgi:hypothetical protein